MYLMAYGMRSLVGEARENDTPPLPALLHSFKQAAMRPAGKPRLDSQIHRMLPGDSCVVLCLL